MTSRCPEKDGVLAEILTLTCTRADSWAAAIEEQNRSEASGTAYAKRFMRVPLVGWAKRTRAAHHALATAGGPREYAWPTLQMQRFPSCAELFRQPEYSRTPI